MCNCDKEMSRPVRIFWTVLLIFGIGTAVMVLLFQPGGLDIGKMYKKHLAQERLELMKEAGYPLPPPLPTASAPTHFYDSLAEERIGFGEGLYQSNTPVVPPPEVLKVPPGK